MEIKAMLYSICNMLDTKVVGDWDKFPLSLDMDYPPAFAIGCLVRYRTKNCIARPYIWLYDDDDLYCFIHELGHKMLNHDEISIDVRQKELETTIFTEIVLRHFGIPFDEFRHYCFIERFCSEDTIYINYKHINRVVSEFFGLALRYNKTASIQEAFAM